ncbi:MAG: exodeoxyribonuclease VII small subunit [Clostridiales bacterium]|nr:exodeoxyribonuclease VII small subunit [Clostridiales bacterium]
MDENNEVVQGEEKEETVEDIFTELDEILAAMDQKDVSLEDSFALYEKGMRKVRQANRKLDLVEKKMLVITQEGEVPFEG